MEVFEDKNRFAFGENWVRFLSVIDEERIQEAEVSLCKMLQLENLRGKSFLDIGCGSGLFSLAARRLGAKVHSFDYDPQSVACAVELRNRYFSSDSDWAIEQGSALGREYMESLGEFDIVYSWGVLHHTGAMWIGIENAIGRVGKGGKLFIAIYNDQGFKSYLWWIIKFFYNKFPRPLNYFYAYCLGFFVNFLNIVSYTLKFKPMLAISPLLKYKARRGMSVKYDLIDWIGGFPFEFARYDVLEQFLSLRGFVLEKGKKAMSLGCHEMVFKRHFNHEK